MLNECQRYSVGGKIDSGILATFSEVKTNELMFKILRRKTFLKFANGVSITWITSYCSIEITFTVIFSLPWYLLPSLLLFLLLLVSISSCLRSRSRINLLACLTEWWSVNLSEIQSNLFNTLVILSFEI